VPAEAVANGPEAELPAQAVILQHMAVVTRGPDQVEANAIPPPVRRAFKPGLEKAVETDRNHRLMETKNTPNSNLSRKSAHGQSIQTE
jgi:hypothetical protein